MAAAAADQGSAGGGHVIEGNGKRKVQRYRKPTREEGVERMVVFPSVDSGKDIITLKTRILTNPPAYRMCTEVNGSNLIDGFNGLLGIHFLIINIFLLLINLENQNNNFTIFLVAQTIMLLIFILFNFPKAKIFLGDGGAYLFGSLISINIIKTNNLNPEISSFFFCIILFYLFFEVFFSFFRKMFQKKSPLKPDGNHLHMIIYKFLKRRNFNDCNYLTSVVTNLGYILITLPAFFLKTNGSFCKYWFIISLLVYLLIYRSISLKISNNENN